MWCDDRTFTQNNNIIATDNSMIGSIGPAFVDFFSQFPSKTCTD